MKRLQIFMIGILCLAGLPGVAQKLVPYPFSRAADSSGGDQLKALTQVTHPNTSFLRLYFAGTVLGENSYLLLEAADGASQEMRRADLENRDYRSANINADRVKVSMIAAAGERNTIRISQIKVNDRKAEAGKNQGASTMADQLPGQAGRTAFLDLNAYPYAKAVGRFTNGTHTFGTGWIAANGAIVTEKYNVLDDLDLIEFNVPPSNGDGTVNHPAPADQYPLNKAKTKGKYLEGTKYFLGYLVEHLMIKKYDGSGKNYTIGSYMVIEALPNHTGKRPGERIGQYFQVTRHPSGGIMDGLKLDMFHYGGSAGTVSQTLRKMTMVAEDPQQVLTDVNDKDRFLVYNTPLPLAGWWSTNMQGAPLTYEGSNVVVGIHSHGYYTSPSLGSGFRNDDMRSDLSNFFSSAMTYVDRESYWTSTTGEIDKPYLKVKDGIAHAPNGAVVSIARGTYSETFVSSKPVILRAPVGKVIIGASAGASARTAAGPFLPGELFTDDPTAFDREDDRPEEAGTNLVSSPNPFTDRTELRYELPEETDVTVAVFDVLGNRVRTLLKTRQPAGNHAVAWDGRDRGGKPAYEGMYVIKLQAGTRARAIRVIKQ
ncbi:MAG: T9SS type A sorting domain-containing protein [Cytophagales bacterium]|nr:T9SS type A sorting domain-containing protein [Cytophagales bacterium]